MKRQRSFLKFSTWFCTGRRLALGLCLGGCFALLLVGALSDFAIAGPGAAPLSLEGLPLGKAHPYKSPLMAALAPAGDVLYVVHHTGLAVEAIDLDSGDALWTTRLNGAPSGITLDTEAALLYVTYGLDQGRVAALQAESGEFVFTMPVGHTPMAPVLSADGASLYVCNRFDNEVVAYGLESHLPQARVAVEREPIAAGLSPDGATLVVAQHLPAQAASNDKVAARVTLIDTESFEAAKSILLPNGSTGLRDVCISPDGAYAYLPHTLARFHLPTTQLERGWMNTSVMSIIDLASESLLTSVLLDDVDKGAANPWGVLCTEEGDTLVVAHAGTHELSVIDRRALHQKIDRVARGEVVSEVAKSLDAIPNDLSFLVGLRERIATPGNGPRGLVMAADTVIATEYFSDSLALVTLREEDTPQINSIDLGTGENVSELRAGEKAFYDASLCFQQWQSCASCHPDMRTDAINWDLLNDGIGNPKNTRSLMLSHQTPPVMISGIRPEAEVAVRAGFRYIQFAQVDESVANSVDTYLSTLQPVPSPQLEKGALSAAARRGRAVFDKAGCMHCHSGPHHTDGKLHNVGSGPDELGREEFVTPPLKEVWRTGPYLFYGQAATIKEVFTKYNAEDQHGQTTDLSEAELEDLVAYILSL